MNIEKKLKAYYQASLKHKSKLDSIKAKAGIETSPKKPWYQRKGFIFSLTGGLCLTAAAAVVVTTVVTKKNSPAVIEDSVHVKNAIVRMSGSSEEDSSSPEVVVSVDESGNVASVYGANDDGKLITSGGSYVGKNYWEVIKDIYSDEIETGYLVPNRKDLSYNEVALTVYSEDGAYASSLKKQVAEYLNSENVETDEEDVSVSDTEEYSELDDSDYVEISDDGSFDEIQAVIDEYYAEVSAYSTGIVKEFCELCGYYQDKIAYYETALEQLTDSWDLYATYQSMIETIKAELEAYSSMYYENFLKDASMYMSYYQTLIDRKIEVITKRSDTTVSEEELSAIEGSLNSAIHTLDSFRLTILNAWSSRLDNTMASLNEFSNLLNNPEFRDVIASQVFNSNYVTAHANYIKEFNKKYSESKARWNSYVESVKAALKENIAKYLNK